MPFLLSVAVKLSSALTCGLQVRKGGEKRGKWFTYDDPKPQLICIVYGWKKKKDPKFYEVEPLWSSSTAFCFSSWGLIIVQ